MPEFRATSDLARWVTIDLSHDSAKWELRGMSTLHKIPFIFAHITSNRIFLKFGTLGQPSINSEMYRIKNPVGGEILELF